jgi:hypothetical protein
MAYSVCVIGCAVMRTVGGLGVKQHWVKYELVCGGGGVSGVSGCHIAFLCGVISGVLLQ